LETTISPERELMPLAASQTAWTFERRIERLLVCEAASGVSVFENVPTATRIRATSLIF
jgi:hypothetical protein